MQTRIESTSNPKIKNLVRLRKSSHYRKEVGLFLLEGKREIDGLLAGEHSLEELYFLEDSHDKELASFISGITNAGIACFEVAEEPMKKISYRGEASKVIGVAKKWDLNLRTPRNQSYDAVLILDEIEKPGNLGAILRTAEAMGVNAVLLSDTSVDFFNPNVIRSSMGLFATQPDFVEQKKRSWNGFVRQNLWSLALVRMRSKRFMSMIFIQALHYLWEVKVKGWVSFGKRMSMRWFRFQ